MLSESLSRTARRNVIDLRVLVGSIAIVLLGASTSAEINLGGRLFYSEVMLLLLLPFLLLRERPHPATEVFHRWILICGILWLWSLGLTDFVRATPFEDWSRGISKVSFVLLNYVALRRLLNTDRKILLMAVGLAIGTAISVQSQDYEPETAWKFGLGAMYAVFIGVACAWKPLRNLTLLPSLAFVALAATSAFMGTRNLAGTAMLAAGVLVVGRVLAVLNAESTRGRIAGVLAVAMIGMVTYSGFGVLSDEGVFGEKIQRKYRDQVRQGGGNLLLGGRAESSIAVIAIADSPILGHGSWAKNRDYRLLYESIRSKNTGQPVVDTGHYLIPTHSFFFSGWVEAGLLGAVWWGLVIFIVLHSLYRLLNWTYPLGPVAVFTACQLLWDIPFSPFGADRRLSVAFALVLLPIAASQATRAYVRRDPEGGEMIVGRS
ncbi:MAG: hypothetical protein IT363_13015 [Methanoregulaceae archaeon]|nr:hypothetical protein [Methanoregulaceae archaeon]